MDITVTHTSMNTAEEKLRMDSLSEKDIMIFSGLDTLPKEGIIPDAYVMALCLEGRATCRMNDHVYELEKNDIFLCQPNVFVENAMTSLDFKCKGVVMSPNYFQSIFLSGNDVWDAAFIIKENPLLHLDDKEIETLLLNFEFARNKLNTSDSFHHKEMVRLLLQAMSYECYDIIAPKIQAIQYNYTSAESIFRRFIALVTNDTPVEREVSYYAEHLCITPKYLSAICKQVSGKTASAIINEYTVMHIKNMLHNTTYTIKEVVNLSGFSNLSFFGKYVRRQLGVSPREYRKHLDERAEN